MSHGDSPTEISPTGITLHRPALLEPVGGTRGRRAAVLGSPVSHSRSPDLHLAAYRALGLADWDYTRRECTADQVAGVLADAAPEWVGFSVTMPGKRAALAAADERTDRAVLVGSANTLVRTERGWRADCTDIDGMLGALAHLRVGTDTVGTTLTRSAVVVGAGGTALPTVAALAAVGITDLTVVARSAERARGVIDLARRLGLTVAITDFVDGPELADAAAASAVVVSTVPAPAAAPLAPALAHGARVVDVIYDPWPTPLATAVGDRGGEIVGGLVMLLNQAYSQVEQFTGQAAPRAAMAAVLDV